MCEGMYTLIGVEKSKVACGVNGGQALSDVLSEEEDEGHQATHSCEQSSILQRKAGKRRNIKCFVKGGKGMVE